MSPEVKAKKLEGKKAREEEAAKKVAEGNSAAGGDVTSDPLSSQKTPEDQASTPSVSSNDSAIYDEDAIFIGNKWVGRGSTLIEYYRHYRHGRLETLLQLLPKTREIPKVLFSYGYVEDIYDWHPFTPESILNDPSISKDELDIRKAMNEDYQQSCSLFSTCDRHTTKGENIATFYLKNRIRWKQLYTKIEGPYDRLRVSYLSDLRHYHNEQEEKVTPFPCEVESQFIELVHAVLSHQKLTANDRRRDDDEDSLCERPGPTMNSKGQINPFENIDPTKTVTRVMFEDGQYGINRSDIIHPIFQMHDPQTMVQLTSLSKTDITKWVTSQRMSKNINVPLLDTIPTEVRNEITPFLQVNLFDDDEDYSDWRTYPKLDLCRLLERACQKVTYSGKTKLSDQIESLKWPRDIAGTGWYSYAGKVNGILEATNEEYEQATIVEVMRKSLVTYCRSSPHDQDSNYIRGEWDKQKASIKTVDKLVNSFIPRQIAFIRQTKENADKIKYTGRGQFNDTKQKSQTDTNKGNSKPGANSKPPAKPKDPTPKPNPTKTEYCSGCGREHPGGFQECNHKTHQYFNTEEGVRYEKSTMGKTLSTELGQAVFRLPLWKKNKTDTVEPKSNKRHKGNELYNSGGVTNITEYINSIKLLEPNNIHKLLSNVLIQTVLYSRKQVMEAEPKGIDTVILLDTGANESDYISKRVADHLVDLGSIIQPCNTKICSGIGHELCITCLGSIEIFLKLKNKLSNEFELILLTAKIIEMTTDILIGSKTIFSYTPNLIDRYSDWSTASKPHVASDPPPNAPTCEELGSNTVEVFREANTVMYISPLDNIEHTYEHQLDVEDDYDVINWSTVSRLEEDLYSKF